MKKSKPKVVIIGGGTGTFVVGSGLNDYDVNITTIVTVADSGGSTGRLRDEFGFLPVGDLRQALASMARDKEQGWIQKLLLYRFEKGSGLEGHNLGNLILTALQDQTGSTAKAVEVASKIFRLQGKVFPITTDDIQLEITYEDGIKVTGEHMLDDSPHAGKAIVNISTIPEAKIYSKSKKAIEEADYIIVGPGDLYGSILPNFVISGTSKVIVNSKAKLIYIANLMSKYAQTHDMSVQDHINEIEKKMLKNFDIVILNKGKISSEVVDFYRKENEFPLVDDVDVEKYQLIRKPLLGDLSISQTKSDEVKRSFIRHDSDKIAEVLMREVILQ